MANLMNLTYPTNLVYLVLGLLVFLGVHSVRIVAEPWRLRTRERLGEPAWKGLYSLLSLLGLGLIIWGFGLARQTPVQLWSPPVGMRHLASLLTLVSFVLLAAAYVPRNRIKARLHHPMVLAVKTWALAHLLANGDLGGMILFLSLLAWAVVDRISYRWRPDDVVVDAPAPNVRVDVIAVVAGVIAYVAMLFLHPYLIGVAVLG